MLNWKIVRLGIFLAGATAVFQVYIWIQTGAWTSHNVIGALEWLDMPASVYRWEDGVQTSADSSWFGHLIGFLLDLNVSVFILVSTICGTLIALVFDEV